MEILSVADIINDALYSDVNVLMGNRIFVIQMVNTFMLYV